MASVPHHTVHGEGRALVLLHSGALAGAEWEAHVEPLSRRFQVIVPDLPGHGSTPLGSERLSVPVLGESVVALLDRLGLDRAHLVGSSMGGATALWVALEHPERVDRLVVFRATHARDEGARQASARIADPDRWRRLGLADWLSQLHEPQGGPDAWKEVVQRVGEAFATAAAGRDVALERLADLEAPTLLVVGDRDPIAPLETVLEMARAIPDAALWVMPDATHVTAVRTWRREIFDKEVERFLLRRRPS